MVESFGGKIMNIQTLNSEQKEKLLNLCQEFFPEYKDVTTESLVEHPSHPDFGKPSVGNIKVSFGVVKFPYIDLADVTDFLTYKEVHWYQLVLSELSKRVWDKFNTNNIYDVDIIMANEYVGWALENEDHRNLIIPMLFENNPVDFLYNFVKECKDKGWFK